MLLGAMLGRRVSLSIEGPNSPRRRPSEVLSYLNLPIATTDLNIYQQKKTIAQGMMDLALISANANQLNYVLQMSQDKNYIPSVVMISMSLILQVVVGVGLIWNSRYNVKDHDEVQMADRANNWTVVAIFLVTILNVFISSFGVSYGDAEKKSPP